MINQEDNCRIHIVYLVLFCHDLKSAVTIVRLGYWDIRMLGHWDIYSLWVGANPAALSALTHFVDRQLQRWMLYCFPRKSQ